MRYFFPLLFISFLFSCSSDNTLPAQAADLNTKSFSLLSKYLNDSFHISISMPDTSATDPPNSYPVVYILDANLYFDVYTAILKKYSEVGLLPQAILVGIGYKDFAAMDSLRQRDYTFPAALAEYEMPVSGKADKFRNFISEELIPQVEKRVPADTTKRILTGHSLGGYYTMYSLLRDLNHSGSFYGYISASPSLHYNNAYLVKEFDHAEKSTTPSKKLFMVFGGNENEEMKQGTGKSIDAMFAHFARIASKHRGLSVKTESFSAMGHMDTQIPGFIQGLRWVLEN